MQTKLEKSEAAMLAARRKYEEVTRKYQQALHKQSRLDGSLKKLERKARTHRLIERGAIFESLIPNAETLTNEQVKELLKISLRTKAAVDFFDGTEQNRATG